MSKGWGIDAPCLCSSRLKGQGPVVSTVFQQRNDLKFATSTEKCRLSKTLISQGKKKNCDFSGGVLSKDLRTSSGDVNQQHHRSVFGGVLLKLDRCFNQWHIQYNSVMKWVEASGLSNCAFFEGVPSENSFVILHYHHLLNLVLVKFLPKDWQMIWWLVFTVLEITACCCFLKAKKKLLLAFRETSGDGTIEL